MRNRILVGVDGSETSLRALDWALEEAKARDWSVLLVNSVPPIYVADPLFDASYLDAAERGAEGILLDARERAAAHGVPVETLLTFGDAGGVLVKQSAEAGLAVVGKRGRGGFTGRLLGSASSGLAAHSKCPVVVVPNEPISEGSGDSQPAGPADAEAALFDGHVVVGVDFGPEHPALGEAVAMARRRGKPVSLVAVRVPLLGDVWSVAAPSASELHEETTAELNKLVASVQERNPDVAVDGRVFVGKPAEVLISASRSADLVVLGTRGHGGFPGLLLGSVSQAVLHHGRSPMMVVSDAWTPEGDAPSTS